MTTLADDSECRGLCLISLIGSSDSLKKTALMERISGELNSMFCSRFIAACSQQGENSWKSRVDYLLSKDYFPTPKFFFSLSIQKSQNHIFQLKCTAIILWSRCGRLTSSAAWSMQETLLYYSNENEINLTLQ